MKIIDSTVLNNLSAQAIASVRKRINLNYHEGAHDTLQRLLNAMEPETYIQPHKHENPDKREVFIMLEGEAAVLIFDDAGKVTASSILNRDTGVYIAEIPPRTWHTIISFRTGTVMYEVKDGPYNPDTDKCFAPWAPSENTAEARMYLEMLRDILFSTLK